jgi:hypothetical protein
VSPYNDATPNHFEVTVTFTGAEWGHLGWPGSGGADAQNGNTKPVDLSYDVPNRWEQTITFSVNGKQCAEAVVHIKAWEPAPENPDPGSPETPSFPVPKGYVAPFTYGTVDNAVLPVTNWFDPTHVYELWGLDGAFMHGKDGAIAIDNFRQDKVLPGQAYTVVDATNGTRHTIYVNNPWGPKNLRFCLAGDDQQVVVGDSGYCEVVKATK